MPRFGKYGRSVTAAGDSPAFQPLFCKRESVSRSPVLIEQVDLVTANT